MTIKESKSFVMPFDRPLTPRNFDSVDGLYPELVAMAERITGQCIAKKPPVTMAIDWMVGQVYGGMKRGKIEYMKRVHDNISLNSKPETLRDKIYLAWNVMVVHFDWPGETRGVSISNLHLPGSAYSGKRSR